MINENDFLSKLLDSYIFVKELGQMVDRDYAVKRAKIMTSGVEDIITDPKMWKDEQLPTKEKVRELVEKVYKKNIFKIENYRKRLYGYGLVLFCAIFDDFLLKLLDEILEENPEFTKWSSKKEIMGRFKESSIKDKCNILQNKLEFIVTDIFDFTMFVPEIQRKFEDVNFNTLIEIYKKRNKAAHSDNCIIYDIKSLEYVRELFEKLIWVLSIKSVKKWKINNIITTYAGKS